MRPDARLLERARELLPRLIELRRALHRRPELSYQERETQRSMITRLTAAGYSSWAVLEWECCYKDSVQGATEGAPFIEAHLIDVPAKAFDDFAGGATDAKRNRRILGLK